MMRGIDKRVTYLRNKGEAKRRINRTILGEDQMKEDLQYRLVKSFL